MSRVPLMVLPVALIAAVGIAFLDRRTSPEPEALVAEASEAPPHAALGSDPSAGRHGEVPSGATRDATPAAAPKETLPDGKPSDRGGAAAPAGVTSGAGGPSVPASGDRVPGFVNGSPWWPRTRPVPAVAKRLRADDGPEVHYGPYLDLPDTGRPSPGKDEGERRPDLDSLTESGDDHGFGNVPHPAVDPGPVPVAPAAKGPEQRIAIHLSVSTEPAAEARVRANGYDLGLAPVTQDMFLRPPGDLEVVVSAPGYADQVRHMRLGADHPGGDVPIRVVLVRDVPASAPDPEAHPAPSSGAR